MYAREQSVNWLLRAKQKKEYLTRPPNNAQWLLFIYMYCLSCVIFFVHWIKNREVERKAANIMKWMKASKWQCTRTRAHVSWMFNFTLQITLKSVHNFQCSRENQVAFIEMLHDKVNQITRLDHFNKKRKRDGQRAVIMCYGSVGE